MAKEQQHKNPKILGAEPGGELQAQQVTPFDSPSTVPRGKRKGVWKEERTYVQNTYVFMCISAYVLGQDLGNKSAFG